MIFINLWKLLFFVQIKVEKVTYNFGISDCHWPKKVTKSFFSYGDFNGNLIVTVYKIKCYIKILIVFFWFSKISPNFAKNTRNFLLFFVKWFKKFFFDVFAGILGLQRFGTWNTLFTITKFMFYQIIFKWLFYEIWLSWMIMFKTQF